MESSPLKEKKRSFSRGLLLFVLGVAALLFVSTVVARLIPGEIVGANRKIAIVEVRGVIDDSQEIIRQLKRFHRDKNVRGIVLRIDSPGGAVGPSQEIYQEVLKIRDSEKPIYASLGTVAASGGYYIASSANRVFANPGTLTGSIGVIMAFSNIEKLIGKIGLRPEVIKSGNFKDTGSPVRPMSAQERGLLQGVVDDVHSQFVEAVAQGRHLSEKEVKKVADGRIFTGRQAHDFQLVDQLGGLQDAIDLLAEQTGIIGRPQIVQEKKSVSFFDLMLKGSISQYLNSQPLTWPGPTLQYLWTLG